MTTKDNFIKFLSVLVETTNNLKTPSEKFEEDLKRFKETREEFRNFLEQQTGGEIGESAKKLIEVEKRIEEVNSQLTLLKSQLASLKEERVELKESLDGEPDYQKILEKELEEGNNYSVLLKKITSVNVKFNRFKKALKIKKGNKFLYGANASKITNAQFGEELANALGKEAVLQVIGDDELFSEQPNFEITLKNGSKISQIGSTTKVENKNGEPIKKFKPFVTPRATLVAQRILNKDLLEKLCITDSVESVESVKSEE